MNKNSTVDQPSDTRLGAVKDNSELGITSIQDEINTFGGRSGWPVRRKIPLLVVNEDSVPGDRVLEFQLTAANIDNRSKTNEGFIWWWIESLEFTSQNAGSVANSSGILQAYIHPDPLQSAAAENEVELDRAIRTYGSKELVARESCTLKYQQPPSGLPYGSKRYTFGQGRDASFGTLIVVVREKPTTAEPLRISWTMTGHIGFLVPSIRVDQLLGTLDFNTPNPDPATLVIYAPDGDEIEVTFFAELPGVPDTIVDAEIFFQQEFDVELIIDGSTYVQASGRARIVGFSDGKHKISVPTTWYPKLTAGDEDVVVDSVIRLEMPAGYISYKPQEFHLKNSPQRNMVFGAMPRSMHIQRRAVHQYEGSRRALSRMGPNALDKFQQSERAKVWHRVRQFTK